jgi:hypothetical protein
MSHILDIEIGTYSLFTDNRNKINGRSNKKIERLIYTYGFHELFPK